MGGVPQDVKTVMIRALKGALDYVLNDIRPDGDNVPDFFELIPAFHFSVGGLLNDRLSELDFTNEQLVNEILTEVGFQFSNTDGPNFE
jgi:hypothetical protein